MKVAILTTDNREHYKDYASPLPYFGIAPEALFQGFSSMPEIEVHVISCTQQPVRSPEQIGANIWFHGLHVPKIGWGRTLFQGCIRAARNRLHKLAPDIVHGQGTERDCAISAVLSGLPNVLTIHGNMAELARLFRLRFGSYGWLAARLEDFTLRRSAGVFCNSEYTEGLVKPRAKHTWRVPNAIREAFFAPVMATPSNSKPVLLNVGLISPRKRQLELLGTLRALSRQGCRLEVQFVGQADPQNTYAAAFLDQIRSLEKEGLAHFVGPKKGPELIRLFDSANALIHFPSEEAFGLVAAESLARGLKFFGSRVGGLLDIAAGVVEAELFAADDWQGLALAIGAWIRSGFPRAPRAAPLMRERYHPAVIARRHLEIYREVLSKAS